MLKKVFLLCVFVLGTLFAQNNQAVPMPMAEKKYEMDYSKDTKCLVRKFEVYKNPKWACKIELQNGKKVFFSSPKSMFEFYHQPGKWFDIGVKKESDFRDIIVTDYNSLKLINAKKAFYIYGTRAISPAGDDLVAFERREDAALFSQRYSGKRIFTFEQVSPSLIRLINGNI